MKDIKTILLGYAAKQFGISEDAAADLLFSKSEDAGEPAALKDDALQILIDKDKARVVSIKKAVDTSEIFTEGYNKAKKDELAKAEKSLSKKYGIEEKGLKLPALLDHIITANSKTGKPTEEMTEDEIKKSPIYLALEKSKASELESLTNAHTQEIEKTRQGYAKAETWQNVKAEVLTIFDDLKPILPTKDGAKVAHARENFARNFESYDYEKQADGSYLILQDGKRVEDAHSNPQSLESLVSAAASRIYDFAKQENKTSSGAGGATAGGALKVPANADDLADAIFEATSPDERAALQDAYDAAH